MDNNEKEKKAIAVVDRKHRLWYPMLGAFDIVADGIPTIIVEVGLPDDLDEGPADQKEEK